MELLSLPHLEGADMLLKIRSGLLQLVGGLGDVLSSSCEMFGNHGNRRRTAADVL